MSASVVHLPPEGGLLDAGLLTASGSMPKKEAGWQSLFDW